MDRRELSIIVVSYNTRALLRECLASIPSRESIEILVVDNASQDGSADMVADDFPRVTLIRAGRNLGFAAANNVALARARGAMVMLLNPDATLTPGATEELLGYLHRHPDVWIVGPTLCYPDGRFQSSGFAFPSVLAELRQSHSVDWLLRRLGSTPATHPAGREPVPVDWVDGACLVIRRDTLEAIGPLDEQYFLYGEEVDWCYRARRAQWQVVAVRAATVVHHQGQSQQGGSRSTVAYLTETRLRFFRTHFGLMTALLVSAIFAAGCAKQLIGSRLARLRGTGARPGHADVRLQAIWRWWIGMSRPAG
jgi:N-acetylglucosaminyl-diphospho-decaprenol L-rhamnosyltransferase